MSQTQPELIKVLIKKNSAFAEWLEVIVRADCRHVDYCNVSVAKELIGNLKEQNDILLDYLTQDSNSKKGQPDD